MCNKKEKENQILSNKKIFTLIGMMGTGKSKFGRLVANNLAYKFYDVDTLIESDQKSTIKTIFQEKGESFFRKIEKNTIKNLIANVTTKEEKSI